jgi:hypothetical protein
LLLATGCNADDGYGIVQIQLQGTSDVFAGTDQITVAVDYLECLSQFYEDNPEEAQEGGSGVFEDWEGKLCDQDISPPLDCDVASIEQGGTTKLTVAYDVHGDVAGRRLAVGPLPTEETADCSGGEVPEIRIAATSAVVGRVDGTSLWHAEAFSSTQAVVDQGAAITVDVAAN